MDITKRTTFFALAVLAVLSVATALMPSGTAEADCGSAAEVTLYGGQVIEVGTVTIWNDDTYLYVSYSTGGGWVLNETHLSVATSLYDIPQTRSGNPIPGKFRYKTEYDPAVTEFTYVIDAGEWYQEGIELFIAAHAVVELDGYETAWADGLDFPGNNWATYFTYIMQPCNGEVPS